MLQEIKKNVLIQIDRLDKTFTGTSGNRVFAIEEMTFDISSGEFVTILGATGCGKTTLLNMIAGLTKPDKGSITFDGDGELEKQIAYVFQHYTLFPWRTVFENIEFGLQMRKITNRRRKQDVAALIEQVGLTGFEKAYPHELSGGMRQRTAIAQAIATRPKLLLMDEPFGSLDDTTRRELQQMLVDLWQQQHVTIIFVTHNIDEALILGSRVIVLRERPGQIIRDIQVDFKRPRDKISKEFTELFIEIRNTLKGDVD